MVSNKYKGEKVDNRKILLVDDDQFVRDSLTELLKSWNYEISEAANGEDALQRVNEDGISAILLDIKLGDTDGLSVLKAIRNLNINVPVIVMTAYPGEYNRNQFFDEQAVAFLTKPVKPSDLKVILETLLNK